MPESIPDDTQRALEHMTLVANRVTDQMADLAKEVPELDLIEAIGGLTIVLLRALHQVEAVRPGTFQDWHEAIVRDFERLLAPKPKEPVH